MHKSFYAVFALLFLISGGALAAPKVGKIAKLDGIPWGMAELDDGNLLVTLKKGKLFHLNLKNGKTFPIKNSIPVHNNGQGGLLDIVIESQNKAKVTALITHSVKSGRYSTTQLSRLHIDLDKKTSTDFKRLFLAKTDETGGRHYGSRILIRDNYIYLTVGDRGERDKAQDMKFHNGKLIRIHKDGSIPKDNPFVKQGKVAGSIYSIGHRNAQGITFNGKSIVVGEHGPRGGDEINVIEKGANYGWPTITYGREYWGPKIGEGTEKKGLKQPLKYFVPSIAPSSLLFYSGSRIKEFKNSYLQGALKLTHLNAVSVDGKTERRFFEGLGERIRQVIMTKDERVLFSCDSGNIFVVPAT